MPERKPDGTDLKQKKYDCASCLRERGFVAMHAHFDRVINGILKADLAASAEEVATRLEQDVAIHVPYERANGGDLSPAIWFLAAVLERQFTGRILIDAGIDGALSGPIALSSRCHLVSSLDARADITVAVGSTSADPAYTTITGDCRSNCISWGSALDPTLGPAHPVTCCALAGYLGFAALARAVGIPPFHESWQRNTITLPFALGAATLPPRLAVLGNGQIGQAFLALGFFLFSRCPAPSLSLIDKDPFDDYNGRTQLLLGADMASWLNVSKSKYLAEICTSWGWQAHGERVEIDWGWKHPNAEDTLGVLAFDNMDARRMGVEAGFPWLVEAGVGTNFCAPRVSWHSLPPERELAKRLFASDAPERVGSESAFAQSLGPRGAACGRVEFENIQATAPSLGLVAVAYVWSEILRNVAEHRRATAGSAYAWSPLLPFLREEITLM
jgi:hypothetical protein